MNGFLIDTNVVSELTKDVPDARVLAFLIEHQNLWLSTIVLHELEFGVCLLPPGWHRDKISMALLTFLTEYRHRFLPVGDLEATQAADFRAQMHRSGRHLNLGDSLIAGTAKVNALAIATRNVRDFENLELTVVNPWDLPPR